MKTKGVSIFRIRDLDDTTFNILKNYGFSSIESFLSIATSSNSYEDIFTHMLGLSRFGFEQLIINAKKSMAAARSPSYRFPARSRRKYPKGAAVPKLKARRRQAAISLDRIEASVNLIPHMSAIKDQGDRGTCVAFSICAAREALESIHNSNNIVLSEECLYYHCKNRDQYCGDGTWVEEGIQVLKKHGICDGSTWAYDPNFDPSNIAHQPPLPCNPYPCNSSNIRYKINEFRELKSFENIKKALSHNLPVVITIPVYKSWDDDAWVEDTGEIFLPLPSDLADKNCFRGHHAICLAGYSEESESFFFKNSWGINWAFNSPIEQGYGQLPFKYVEQYKVEAYCFNL
jgi:C1A family cysteine protease